jgi:hypothetical protein
MNEETPFLIVLLFGLILGLLLIIDYFLGSNIFENLWNWWSHDFWEFMDFTLGLVGKFIYILLTLTLIVGVCLYAPGTVIICLFFLVKWAFKK